jgi:cbb3-type cytochrome oxidase maturation protein
MSILFVLVPLGLVLLAIAVWAFFWAVDHDQFDELDRAAHSILFDDDISSEPESEPEPAPKANDTEVT